ncbi:MAG: HD domain-containing protein [Alsobacter sp.]
MFTVSELAADALGPFLADDFRRTFGRSEAPLAESIETAARLALECIGLTDAPYHNVEHTMMVALVARDMLRGRYLLKRTTPQDWLHVLLSCLYHDIGYVRGVLNDDRPPRYVASMAGEMVELPRGATDAWLTPYHVDRGKLFVLERLRDAPSFIDAQRIADAIECTRFPPTNVGHEAECGALTRAADLIGQLGDPSYLRKAFALFCEFREIGMDKKLGYDNPADVIERYPDFFMTSIAPHIQVALRYLGVTAEGRAWIARLDSNVFAAERGRVTLHSDGD